MISAPGPFTPNSYQFAAAQKDGAGNTSPLSPSVTIQIVTAGTVPTLALDPGSDSGTPGDGITNVNGSNGIFPQFDVGNVVPGATLTLLRNGVVVNTLTNAAGGTAVIGDQRRRDPRRHCTSTRCSSWTTWATPRPALP